jgi:hypothetical protein
MASANKQQKRAKRAKDKAKQQRVARQNPQALAPIVPDYFMPDFLDPDDEELDNTLLLESYLEPEVLAEMTDEEREAAIAFLDGGDGATHSEVEILLWDLYRSPAPVPTEAQRIAHYKELMEAEAAGEGEFLLTFTKGPIAAHALHDIDFANFPDILTNTLGAYWKWAHGLDDQTIRTRIDNDDFYESFYEALCEIEDEALMEEFTIDQKKPGEPAQD